MTKQTKTLMTLAAVGGIAFLVHRSRQQQVNGLDGFGSSFKKKLKKITKTVKKSSPLAVIKKIAVKSPVFSKSKLVQKLAGSKPKTSVQVEAAAPANTEVEYQDENGNPITKAQYDSKVAEYEAAQRQADADAAAAAQAAAQPKLDLTKYTAPPPPRGSANSSFNRGDEELVIRSTESNDYSDGASAGSPGLPPIQTSVQEPAVQYETAINVQPEKKGNGAALAAGGVLAAAAAFLMMK